MQTEKMRWAHAKGTKCVKHHMISLYQTNSLKSLLFAQMTYTILTDKD